MPSTFSDEKFWETLAKIPENGSIGTSYVLNTNDSFGHLQSHERAKKNVLKKVWRMTDKFVFTGRDIELVRGKGADGEATWQPLLELFFEA